MSARDFQQSDFTRQLIEDRRSAKEAQRIREIMVAY
jgi:hypothetical protein